MFLNEHFKSKPHLTSLQIELTSRCNEQCIHCYIPHENKIEDRVYQHPISSTDDIAVFGVDQEALDMFGRYWDWSRQYYADAINILNSDPDYKPAVIALDFLLTEPGADPVADENLAKAAKDGGNVVVVSEAKQSVNLRGEGIIEDYITPYPQLAESVAAYGFADSNFDSDGVERETRLNYDYNGEKIYSFPYEVYQTYMRYMGEEPGTYPAEQDKAYIAYSQEPNGYTGSEGCLNGNWVTQSANDIACYGNATNASILPCVWRP